MKEERSRENARKGRREEERRGCGMEKSFAASEEDCRDERNRKREGGCRGFGERSWERED